MRRGKSRMFSVLPISNPFCALLMCSKLLRSLLETQQWAAWKGTQASLYACLDRVALASSPTVSYNHLYACVDGAVVASWGTTALQMAWRPTVPSFQSSRKHPAWNQVTLENTWGLVWPCLERVGENLQLAILSVWEVAVSNCCF